MVIDMVIENDRGCIEPSKEVQDFANNVFKLCDSHLEKIGIKLVKRRARHENGCVFFHIALMIANKSSVGDVGFEDNKVDVYLPDTMVVGVTTVESWEAIEYVISDDYAEVWFRVNIWDPIVKHLYDEGKK